MRIWSISALIIAALTTSSAHANYYLGKFINNTNTHVTFASLVPPGQTVTRASLGRNGMKLAAAVPDYGLLLVYEDGTQCPGFSWAAIVEYAGQKWGFGYEGDGIINLTLNADNSLTVGGSGTPGGNGHVFPGGC